MIETPYYLIDETLLRRNLALISRVAQDADVEIIIAFKAFANWRTFPIIREYIDGCTASSLWEAMLAVEEFGAQPHTYSPAYTERDFPYILANSKHITFNSLTQYERFAISNAASYGLRINPEYSAVETDLYNPCSPGTRFGITATNMPTRLPAGIEGFHCHALCEGTSYELEKMLQHIEEKFAPWLPQLKWLNLGGGHLMTHEAYDTEHLTRVLKDTHQRHPNLHLVLEPGAAFVWQTGVLVSRVVDIVENDNIRTAILDISFTCHTPDCLEMPYQPSIRGAQKSTNHKHTHTYRLGGNSCLSGDYLGLWTFPQSLNIGDEIVLEDMIHYTTVKTTMFNGINHPTLAIQHADGTVEVLRQYGYEDYHSRMD